MPDLIKMKTGTIANLEHETNSQPDIALDRGSVYFAVDTTNHIGKIVYDAPVGTNGVDRIVMSTQAEYADEATLAGNVSGVVAIANGGTGGTTASTARANLGLGNGKIFIGTCSTAAATVAKEVVCAEFTANDLIKGSIVLVSFSETNSGAVANLTLNVNNTGAKNIKKYYNSGINNLTAKGELIANSTIPFVYNGTYWVAFGLDYNNTYSTMSQTEADTGTATSGRVISAKVLSDTIANNISNSLSNIDAMIYKGTISSSSSLPAIHEAGWTYKITTAGTYVGENCEVGDLIICIADGTAANDNDWTIIQKNIDKGLFKSSNTFTNGDMLLADGTDGKVKSIAINPTLTLTAGTSSTAPKLKIAVGGINSDESTINTATTGLYGVTKLSNTSSSNEEGLAATPKGVWNAINTLDGVLTGTPGASKTLTAFEQTNGKVSATFSNIAIGAGQITSGTLAVGRGGTGETSIANIKAGKDADGNTITETYATKSELSELLALNDAMIFKGTITTASDVPNPPYDAGWTYKVATFGTYAGKICEVGDLFICVAEKAAGETASNNDWMVVQTNLDNGLFKGTNVFADGQMLLADSTVGKVKAVSISPTINMTSGTSSAAPNFTITVGGETSSSASIGTATTGIYGATKLSDAVNSTSTSLAATANAVKKVYDLAASKTDNVGTITGITANAGLTGGGTSGTVTIGHSNSTTAITSEGLYKVKWDAQGHITGALLQNVTDNTSNADVTSTDTNLITARTLYYQLAKKGYTTNTGTVTSVTAGGGLAGDTITTSGTISHATKNSALESNTLSGGDGTVIKSITIDDYGHISGYLTTAAVTAATAAAVKIGHDTYGRVVIGDALTASDVGAAASSHTHGNITNDGKIGTNTAANKAVYTTTNGALTTGTLPVAAGGTGATTFTSGALLIGNGTNAVGTRAITNNTSNTAITNSNTNIPTMNTIYYGLVTVNGASQTRATGIYAPTGTGTAGQILISTGSTTKTPAWKTLNNHTYTPAGTVSQPTFTGDSLTSTGKFTPAGSVAVSTNETENKTATVSAASSGTTTYQPAGTNTAPAFTGTATTIVVNGGTGTVTYTPAGSVSVSTNATMNKTATVSVASSGDVTYTPGGSVTRSTDVAVNTTTVNSITAVGTASTWAFSVSNENLTISGANSTVPTKGADTTVATSIKTQPAFSFSGTGVRLVTGNIAVPNTYTATFTGTGTRLTASYTPAGSVAAPTFTGTAVRLVTGNIVVPKTYTATFTGTEGNLSVTGTPSGTVSQPTFTGTEATLTHTTS